MPILSDIQKTATLAAQEASRFGHTTLDLEHLLLALVADGGQAGRMLRYAGLTLARTRAAVAAQHDKQLALLGIDIEIPTTSITHDDGVHYEYSDRALELLRTVAGEDDLNPALARRLLHEPSGLIQAILADTGVNAAELEERLAGAVDKPARGTFVHASPARVREFLVDAQNVPTWSPGIESVAETPNSDGSWLAEGTAKSPAWRRRSLSLSYAGDRSLTWRMTFPETRRALPLDVTFGIAEASGGCLVSVSPVSDLSGTRGLRRMSYRLAGPLLRWSQRMLSTGIEGNLSAAFR